MIHEISNDYGKLAFDQPEIVISANERKKIDGGALTISDVRKEIELNVVYSINGERKSGTYMLKRRTESELSQYFGENGTPPYPWY